MPEKEEKLYSYNVRREGGEDVLYINYMGASYVPNLADYPEVMSRTVDNLIENPSVSRIIFVQQKNYNYDFKETTILLEIAQLYIYLLKQEKILSQEKLVTLNEQSFSQRYNEVFSFLLLLRQDPISAYFELKKLIIQSKILLEKISPQYKNDQENYAHLLEKIFTLLENTKMIQIAIPYLDNYKKGDREIYNKILKPDIIPNFTFTRLISDLPDDVEILDQYQIGEEYDLSTVTIFEKKKQIETGLSFKSS